MNSYNNVTWTYLAITGSCQKFWVSLWLNPFETKDKVTMPISYIANADVCGTCSHVPQRDLSVQQASREQLPVPVVELDPGDRVLWLHCKIWKGKHLCKFRKYVHHSKYAQKVYRKWKFVKISIDWIHYWSKIHWSNNI